MPNEKHWFSGPWPGFWPGPCRNRLLDAAEFMPFWAVALAGRAGAASEFIALLWLTPRSRPNSGRVLACCRFPVFRSAGAQERLAQEFPKDIADKFEYLWLATNSQKNGDYVDPGVGGSVYERLGFVNEVEKNKYTPQIVKTRRAQYAVEA
ncbi:MAG: hypothetical protein IPH35_05880 [Rhodoferax sp.]|nr:hypothetical protein [Rhodoferax sp.]